MPRDRMEFFGRILFLGVKFWQKKNIHLSGSDKYILYCNFSLIEFGNDSGGNSNANKIGDRSGFIHKTVYAIQ